MARTPAEKAATEAIEAAIEAYRVAFREAHPEATEGTLTDWVVVAVDTKPNMDEPSDDVTAYSIIMANGGIPWYRAIGLLTAGMQFLENNGMEK